MTASDIQSMTVADLRPTIATRRNTSCVSRVRVQIAEVYERGISLLQQVERYKHYLSICNSTPWELLTRVALKARGGIPRSTHPN